MGAPAREDQRLARRGLAGEVLGELQHHAAHPRVGHEQVGAAAQDRERHPERTHGAEQLAERVRIGRAHQQVGRAAHPHRGPGREGRVALELAPDAGGDLFAPVGHGRAVTARAARAAPGRPR